MTARTNRKLQRIDAQQRRTLDELDPPAWGPPDPDGSSLVVRCHELRRAPLGDFSVEDLRLMIGQSIGLRHLIPIAINRLQANPLAEGHNYAGDLLKVVLGVEEQYWRANRAEWDAVDSIVDSFADAWEELEESMSVFQSRPL